MGNKAGDSYAGRMSDLYLNGTGAASGAGGKKPPSPGAGRLRYDGSGLASGNGDGAMGQDRGIGDDKTAKG